MILLCESDHINYLTIVDEYGVEQVIETTDVHPFWVVTDTPDLDRAARSYADGMYHENLGYNDNGFWVEAKDLRVGDVFLGANGEISTLTNIVRVEQEGGIDVFNIAVEGNHNYFILAKEYEYGQTCILVHNAEICFRVMDEAEYADALRGKWEDSMLVLGDPTEIGSKWVWDNAESAQSWQDFLHINGETENVIAIVEIRDHISTYPSEPHPPEGTAYHVPIPELIKAIGIVE